MLSLGECTLLFKSGGKRDRRINFRLERNFLFLQFLGKIFLVLERDGNTRREHEFVSTGIRSVVVSVALVCGATLVSLSTSLFSGSLAESLRDKTVSHFAKLNRPSVRKRGNFFFQPNRVS